MNILKKYKSATCYIVAFFIPFIIILLSFIFNSFAPFGSLDIMSSSGNEEYVTYILKFSDYIHKTYSGNDINEFYFYYLSDPSNLLISLFPRTAIPTLIDVFYCIKLSLAGLSFFYYIQKKHESKNIPLALVLSSSNK